MESRHWQMLRWLGLIFTVPVIFKVLDHIARWIGILKSPEDAMWLIDKFREMPWWIALFMLFASWMTIALWPMIRRQIASSEAKYSTSEVPLSELKETKPTPNWCIKKLFLYIDPNLLEGDQNKGRWLPIGQFIRDCQANHGLTVWGRKTEDENWENHFIEDNANKLPPHEKLENDYFQNADFCYLFLGDEHQFALHTTRDNDYSDTPIYTDLQVNSDQAISVLERRRPSKEKAAKLYEATTHLRGVIEAGRSQDIQDAYEQFEPTATQLRNDTLLGPHITAFMDAETPLRAEILERANGQPTVYDGSERKQFMNDLSCSAQAICDQTRWAIYG